MMAVEAIQKAGEHFNLRCPFFPSQDHEGMMLMVTVMLTCSEDNDEEEGGD